MIDPSALVHPLACVDASARVGARSYVWQFATLIRGASIGADSSMAAGACLDGSHAGDRARLGHNLAAGPGFLIGNDCFIGPNCTLANDAFPRAHKAGWSPTAFDGKRWAIIIEDGASVGANCVILPGVRIGRGAMIAAGSVVKRDVPARTLHTQSGDLRPMSADGERMRFARSIGALR